MAHDLTRWPPGVLVRLGVEINGKWFEPFDAVHAPIVTSTLAIDHGETCCSLGEFFFRHMV